MGFPAGVGRDFEGLERRRMRAARLLAKGLSQSEVARRVGAHRQSVSRWAAALHAQGPGARGPKAAMGGGALKPDGAQPKAGATGAGIGAQLVEGNRGGPFDRAGM